MSELHVTTIPVPKARDTTPAAISSSTTLPFEIDRSHSLSESVQEKSPLKRIDSGFFEGTCQTEAKVEPLACVKDNRSCRARSSTPQSQTGYSIVPNRLKHAIRRDLWSPSTLLHTVHHGYLHSDVCNDQRIAALCSHAANSSQNMEVVKHKRVLCEGRIKGPTFKTFQLYGPGAPSVGACFQRWAAARNTLHQRQARANVAKFKAKQRRADGGLLASLRRRIDRPARCPRIVHCRVNKPVPPEKTLLSHYTNAFKAWDAAMSESIPGYADNYEKRHWYISQWDEPSRK